MGGSSKGIMSKTLLDRAKESEGKGRGDVNNEHIDLAIAWLKGEISTIQARSAVGGRSGASIYVLLARSLREAARRGIIGELK